jgi:hypothetical protein
MVEPAFAREAQVKLLGEQDGLIVEDRATPAQQGRHASPDQSSGQRAEEMVGSGGFAGGKKEQPGRPVRLESGHEVVGGRFDRLAEIIFQNQHRFGLQSAVAGEV